MTEQEIARRVAEARRAIALQTPADQRAMRALIRQPVDCFGFPYSPASRRAQALSDMAETDQEAGLI